MGADGAGRKPWLRNRFRDLEATEFNGFRGRFMADIEIVDDGAPWRRPMARRSKEMPKHVDGWKVIVIAHHLRQRQFLWTEQEFIDVDKGHPAAVLPKESERVGIGKSLGVITHDEMWPWNDGDVPGHNEWFKYFRRVVGAAIVVNCEMIHSDREVKREPFAEIFCFVLHDRCNRDIVAALRFSGDVGTRKNLAFGFAINCLAKGLGKRSKKFHNKYPKIGDGVAATFTTAR